MSNLKGVENHKKLLSPLNSPPSICAEYKISSKLKHLPFFIQNYGLKDDRCQHWQVSRITENYCHQWIQHLQIVHYAKFRGKWLTPFPVPRSPFSKFSLYMWKTKIKYLEKFLNRKKLESSANIYRHAQVCLKLIDKNLLNKTFGKHFFSNNTLLIWVFNLILLDWWCSWLINLFALVFKHACGLLFYKRILIK